MHNLNSVEKTKNEFIQVDINKRKREEYEEFAMELIENNQTSEQDTEEPFTKRFKISHVESEQSKIKSNFLMAYEEAAQTLENDDKDGSNFIDFIKKQLPLFKMNPNLINAKIRSGPFKNCTPLLSVTSFKCWDLAKEMLKLNPHADINATLAEDPDKGKTPLWYAASWQEWDIVREMLKGHPNADINTTPAECPYKGITPLLYAAFFSRWDIVREMLKGHPDADINAKPVEGRNKGTTPLLCAAGKKEWGIVEKMLKGRPNADINAAMTEGPTKGKTPLLHAALCAQWGIVERMIKCHPEAITHSNVKLDPACQSALELILDELASETLGEHHSALKEIAYLAALDFTKLSDTRLEPFRHEIKCSLERVITLINTERDDHTANPIFQLPEELQRLVVLETFRTDCPHLAWLSDEILLTEMKGYMT